MTAATLPPVVPARRYNGFLVATNTISTYTTKKMSALPKSLEITRITTWIPATTAVVNTSKNVADSCKALATKKTKIIFTNSEGWNVTPPMEYEILDPFVYAPNMSTTASAAIPTSA